MANPIVQPARYCTHGYERCVRGADGYIRHEAAADAYVAAARPILAWSRITGEPVALVPSNSQPNTYHLTTADTCSCKGFSYRARCSHLAPVVQRTASIPLIGRLYM